MIDEQVDGWIEPSNKSTCRKGKGFIQIAISNTLRVFNSCKISGIIFFFMSSAEAASKITKSPEPPTAFVSAAVLKLYYVTQ